jgi:hypothetical protein
MTWNTFVRQLHRWLSIFFTLTVIANFVALFMGQQIDWLTYLPLPPLFLMLLTGLYMFFLPAALRLRRARST